MNGAHSSRTPSDLCLASAVWVRKILDLSSEKGASCWLQKKKKTEYGPRAREVDKAMITAAVVSTLGGMGNDITDICWLGR